jgi:hypothetical protein
MWPGRVNCGMQVHISGGTAHNPELMCTAGEVGFTETSPMRAEFGPGFRPGLLDMEIVD